jgi:predicted ATPase
MRIDSVQFKQFTVFKEARLDFCDGINVFIGANATGKSHVLKILYAIMKTRQQVGKGMDSFKPYPERALQKKVVGVFRPDDGNPGRLIRRAPGRKSAEIKASIHNKETVIRLTSLGNLSLQGLDLSLFIPCIFIPSREVLAMYEGFMHAYQERELSFDETYFDLCLALSGRPVKGPRKTETNKLISPLEKLLGGHVRLEGERFYLQSEESAGKIEAHLMAEGWRKIACLAHLISNGTLESNGVLFWDEPEANLNPDLVTKVVDILRHLASQGVQVFLATHDYLLSQELSLAAEYSTSPVSSRFFCFSRQRGGSTSIESGAVLSELSHNPILEEFAAHYDREQKLFSETPAKGASHAGNSQ